MRGKWRIALATTVLALATPYAAGLMALGYGFNEHERHGALYQWLYAGPLSLQSALAERKAPWLATSVVIYAVQYLVLFILVRYGIVLLQRAVNAIKPSWPEGARALLVLALAAAALIAGLSLLGMPMWFAPLPTIILLLICHPWGSQSSVATYAEPGT
jgi:hypothetical protein